MNKFSKDLKFTSIDSEKILDGLMGEHYEVLVKFMDLTIKSMGNAILTKDLEKNSFASVGTELSSYQGAVNLRNRVVSMLRETEKKALKERKNKFN